VPTFIENTLRCVLRPSVTQRRFDGRREADTCVVFFYILKRLRRRYPAAGFSQVSTPSFDHSQKRVIDIPVMGQWLDAAPRVTHRFLKSLTAVSHLDAPSTALPENKGDKARQQLRRSDEISL
jgi:hypothetical protein